MPRSTREQLIRFYDQANNDLDRCLSNLYKMYDIYKDGYPKQTTMIEQIAGMVVNLQALLKQFRDELM